MFFGKKLPALLAALLLAVLTAMPGAAEEAVAKLVIAQPPEKTQYVEGEPFDPAGAVINAVLEDGSVLEGVDCAWTCGEPTPNGSCVVEFTYGGKSVMQVVFYTKAGNTEPYSVAATERSPDSPLAGKTFVFLGSSVTYGASSGKESMVDFLAARDGAVCYKEAVSGTTLACPKGANGRKSYVTRFEKFLADGTCPVTPDAFICQLSTNDMHHPETFGAVTAADVRDKEAFDRETTFGAMEYIIVLAQEQWGCPVLFYTNTNMGNAAYETMLEGLDAIAEKWGVTVIDLYRDEAFNDITDEARALYMADEIHPTKAGYRDWWLPKFEAALTELLSRK